MLVVGPYCNGPGGHESPLADLICAITPVPIATDERITMPIIMRALVSRLVEFLSVVLRFMIFSPLLSVSFVFKMFETVSAGRYHENIVYAKNDATPQAKTSFQEHPVAYSVVSLRNRS